VRLVQLAGEKIDDDVLARVAEMKDLEYLRIKWAKISDKGVASLARLPKIQHLSILYSPVTDAAAESLEQTQSLSGVRLFGTKVSRAAAMKLNLALGGNEQLGKKVDHRAGAFLGVGGGPDTLGCRVGTVQPNSVAQKAGIQIDDVIVRFNGEQIADFEALTAAIAKCKPSAEVKLELLRSGETRKFEVTLGEWDW
jgi:predicted metalloprotease with PDZ domain